MNVWRFEDTVALVGLAWVWLVGVTMPLAMTATMTIVLTVSAVQYGWGGDPSDLLGALWFALVFEVVIGIAALGGALVSLPFTHVLGVLLRDVRSVCLQVVATAVLAGGLATITAWTAGEALAPFSGPFFGLFLGVSAGLAGALARWGQLRARARAQERVRAAGFLALPTMINVAP